MTICKEKGCKKHASYGIMGTKKRIYCKSCAPSTYVSVSKKKCLYKGCNTNATYGKEGTKNAEYCINHKPDEYVDVVSKKCSYKGCKKQASYGKEGTKIREYCGEHKPKEYVEIGYKKCLHKDCKTHATYGKTGTNIREYCVNHKPNEYVDVVNKKCSYENCSKNPIYGKKGTKNREYCIDHKPNDYVDVMHIMCSYETCDARATYGKNGSKTPEYCSNHKLDDYVDVDHKKCSYEDENCNKSCNKNPTYGEKGTTNAEYCVGHAPNDYIDVRYTMCSYKNNDNFCGKRASYGIPGYSPEYCTKHKSNIMVIRPTKYKNGYITCQICDIKVHYTDQYCSGCKTYLINNQTVKGKQKELEINNLLEDNKIDFVHDLTVKGGCSRKRPDFVIYTEWGINFKRKGFNTILDSAIRGDIEKVVVTYRDRLCRFGFELIQKIITTQSNGKIVVLNNKETTPEQELVTDLISIITVFSARLYGLRSHQVKNRIKNREKGREKRG
jgi:hypothetical protein